LVGGLAHFLFSPIVGMMIQSDFHIFQRGGSTTNQIGFDPPESHFNYVPGGSSIFVSPQDGFFRVTLVLSETPRDAGETEIPKIKWSPL